MIVIIEEKILSESVSIKVMSPQESREIVKVVLDLMLYKMPFEYKDFLMYSSKNIETHFHCFQAFYM